MSRPAALNPGPMLFRNSLRDWQARYKASRASQTTDAVGEPESGLARPEHAGGQPTQHAPRAGGQGAAE